MAAENSFDAKLNMELEKWADNGHFTFRTINSKMEFNAISKNSKNLVLFCYHTPKYHDGVERYLRLLCLKHYQTRFCKVDVSVANSLRKYLKLKDEPAIVLCRDRKPVAYIGYKEYKDYNIDELEWRISKSGVVKYDEDFTYEDYLSEYEKLMASDDAESAVYKRYNRDVVIAYDEKSNDKYRYFT